MAESSPPPALWEYAVLCLLPLAIAIGLLAWAVSLPGRAVRRWRRVA